MTEAGSARRHRRVGGGVGRVVVGVSVHSVLCFSGGLRHPGLGLAPAVTEAGFQP